jgi:excisionase family DNA binding protein
VSEWLTIDDLAAMLVVAPRTVIRWTKLDKGALLAMRVGNVTRIRRTTLERWLAARERAA